MTHEAPGHPDAASGVEADDVGTCRFGPLDIAYGRQVLEPRAWTLAQSRWAAELAADADAGPLLELCAGAGHIGLAAAVLADRDLVQVEVDEVAAGYARRNADRAGWSGRVQVRIARLEDALSPDERFPLVLADPPYVRSRDVGRFPEDPRLAIDGGDDGLAVVRVCLAVAARHLLAGGPLLLQLAGPGQVAEVAALTAATPAWGLIPEASTVVDQERAIVLLRRSR
jgi:methylase of polypeptide subunit release factors